MYLTLRALVRYLAQQRALAQARIRQKISAMQVSDIMDQEELLISSDDEDDVSTDYDEVSSDDD